MFETISDSLGIDKVEVVDVDDFMRTSADDTDVFVDDAKEPLDEVVGSAAATFPPSLVLGAGSSGEALPPSPSAGADAPFVSVVVGVPSPQVARETLANIGGYHGESPYTGKDTFGVTEAGSSSAGVASGAGGGASSCAISGSGTASGPVIVSAGSSSSAPASASFQESSIRVPWTRSKETGQYHSLP